MPQWQVAVAFRVALNFYGTSQMEWYTVKPLITDSEKWTISKQRSNAMPPIDFTCAILIVHLKSLRRGHLSTPDSGHRP